MLVLAPMVLEAGALKLASPRLVVRRTGVGPARSRHAARTLRVPPDETVIVAGLCGALRPDRAPGDLVVPRELRGMDGRVQRLGGPDPSEALRRAGFVVHGDPIVGADHAVTGAERASLAQAGAGAVDMESLWLADAAPGRLSVVRVVLDGPDHELFHPGTLPRLGRGLARLAAVARFLSRWTPTPARAGVARS